jgi:hypothetical protein
MKKNIFSLLLSVLVLTTASAQNADYRNVLSFNAGYSLFNTLASAQEKDVTATEFSASALPTLQLAYDHGFGKSFSLGGAVSFNNLKSSAKGFEFIDANDDVKVTDYDLTVNRITIGARTLFHYGNKGKLDMYSGARLGIGIWSFDAKGSNANFDVEEEFGQLRSGVAPQIQIIPFGLRGYVTENIGIGFETAIGSPYMASLQLTYRMGGSRK